MQSGRLLRPPQGAKANLNEWVELSNGCMCCAVKSEFVQAIETLMTKRANFDHILIETTGGCLSAKRNLGVGIPFPVCADEGGSSTVLLITARAICTS